MVEYLKLPEVARRLDVSEKTARRYVKSGALPSVFIGNAYRVSEEDLEKYLRRAKVQPGDLDPKVPSRLSSEPPEKVSEEEQREPSLLSDPRIVVLLREWGYQTDEEYKNTFQDFDPDIDEKGMPRGLERAEEKLQQDFNELLRELGRPTNYKKLFPERSSFPEADDPGSAHIQVLRASYASKLRREVRRVYERRFRALESFGEALYDAGRTKNFLVPARRRGIVKAARDHALEVAFAKQQAG